MRQMSYLTMQWTLHFFCLLYNIHISNDILIYFKSFLKMTLFLMKFVCFWTWLGKTHSDILLTYIIVPFLLTILLQYCFWFSWSNIKTLEYWNRRRNENFPRTFWHHVLLFHFFLFFIIHRAACQRFFFIRRESFFIYRYQRLFFEGFQK